MGKDLLTSFTAYRDRHLTYVLDCSLPQTQPIFPATFLSYHSVARVVYFIQTDESSTELCCRVSEAIESPWFFLSFFLPKLSASPSLISSKNLNCFLPKYSFSLISLRTNHAILPPQLFPSQWLLYMLCLRKRDAFPYKISKIYLRRSHFSFVEHFISC